MRVILAMAGQAIHRQRRPHDVLGDVAGLAIEVAVRPRQRIARLRVVIVAPALPAVRVVAERAVQPQTALMMLVAVAGVAFQRRALELQRAMALLAGNDRVASYQRKPGNVVIECRCLAPTGLVVTLLASGSELALVLVVLLVTRQAGGRQLFVIDISGMAEVALDRHMRGPQRVFRLVVIEANRLPLVLVVATLALGAVTPGVNVLNPVTIQTLGTDALVAFAAVACGAADGGARALQRKFRRAVVERLDLPPFGLAVAVAAFFAEAPLV